MHEMGIANSILEAVRTELQRHSDARATKVGVRIGELAAIDEDALQFCFGALARESDLDGLTLAVELCPRRHCCRKCQSDFVIRDHEFQCPLCGEMSAECVSGDELDLTYLEIEENEPSPVGAKSTE